MPEIAQSWLKKYWKILVLCYISTLILLLLLFGFGFEQLLIFVPFSLVLPMNIFGAAMIVEHLKLVKLFLPDETSKREDCNEED